jgi:hypothetical protein
MKSEEFFRLTWYEWCLQMYRIRKIQERRIEDRDFAMVLTGDFMALMANVNRNTEEKPEPFSRKDFFRLSTDEPEPEIIEEKPMTLKEAKAALGSKIRR